MTLYLRPWTVKAGKPWVEAVHRRLPKVQGAMWCVCVRTASSGDVVGAALVGHAARVWSEENTVLGILRGEAGRTSFGRHAPSLLRAQEPDPRCTESGS